jgi:LmbE family N-acetylglucosaminyl deacetylase
MLEDAAEESISSGEPTVGLIKRAVDQLQPTIVYVHSRHDRSAVHRAVHDATALAAASVPTIACYQSSTSTVDFRPIRFIPITDQLENKLSMLACFATEGRRTRYLEPEFATATARYWGRFAQGSSCEPLEILRDSAEVA